MHIPPLSNSLAARLALGNGALLVGLILLISAVLYSGTVGVLNRGIDGKVVAISQRLIAVYGSRPPADLQREINRELEDGIDSDTEIFLITSPTGTPVAGNMSRSPGVSTPVGRLFDQRVIRGGRPSFARLFVRPLPNGGFLYVGRDLGEQRAIRDLVLRALEAAAAVSLLLILFGAWFLRHRIEHGIGEIRRTALEIEGGNLQRRIVIQGDDEFARLGIDINRMLDRIEQLMNGVRHVSNAIAHDLRTPLARIRARLDEAISRRPTASKLTDAGRFAIEEIDDLILLLNKLLQIAEAESGMRTATFERIDLSQVIRDMAELYDASAEQSAITLSANSIEPVWAMGDRDLLASAVASLLDNAIKYAGAGSIVELRTDRGPDQVAIIVQDNGPGVPDEELPKLPERFYRMDTSRQQPGNGLGLAIVAATASLHRGKLTLDNAHPGLRACILLPAADPFRGRRHAALNARLQQPCAVA